MPSFDTSSLVVGDTVHFTLRSQFAVHRQPFTGTVTKITKTRQITVAYDHSSGSRAERRFAASGDQIGGYAFLISAERYENDFAVWSRAKARLVLRGALQQLGTNEDLDDPVGLIKRLHEIVGFAEQLIILEPAA